MIFISYIQEMFELAKMGNVQGIFFFCAVYTFLTLLFSLILQIKQNSWSSVTGDLCGMEVEEFGTEKVKSKQNYVIEALYTYRVKEKNYKGSRISPWIIVASYNARFVLRKQLSLVKVTEDGKVEVFYNPKRPEKSWLIRAGIKSQVVTAIFACLPFVFYWFKYYG